MSTLNVTNIASATGTTAQTIDSTGRILTPARPAFRAYLSSNTGVLDFTGDPPASGFIFDSESYDIGGNYDTSNGKFIVPITGLYQFNVVFYAGATTSADWCSTYLFVGNTQISRTIIDPQGGNYGAPQLTDVLQLTAGQEVTARFATYNDTGIDISGDSDGSLTHFGGYLIG
jgi:hypothetical protein